MTKRQNAAPSTSTPIVAQPSTRATPSLTCSHGPGTRCTATSGK